MPVWESVVLFILSIWALIWKGLALWRASKLSQRNWFIVLLVLNTVGILEIVYLFRFATKKMTVHELKLLIRGIFFTPTKS